MHNAKRGQALNHVSRVLSTAHVSSRQRKQSSGHGMLRIAVSPRKQPGETCKLAEAQHDAARRHVCDVAAAMEWQQVGGGCGRELDVAHLCQISSDSAIQNSEPLAPAHFGARQLQIWKIIIMNHHFLSRKDSNSPGPCLRRRR